MTAEELEKVLTVIGSSGVMCGIVPDTPKARAELRANGFEISNGTATRKHKKVMR